MIYCDLKQKKNTSAIYYFGSTINDISGEVEFYAEHKKPSIIKHPTQKPVAISLISKLYIKYKAEFSCKAKMLTPEQVDEMIGHSIGGVCPFAVNEGVKVYLDESLKRFETVFPACGSSNSAIELDCDTLFTYSRAKEWIDVCKGWQDEV